MEQVCLEDWSLCDEETVSEMQPGKGFQQNQGDKIYFGTMMFRIRVMKVSWAAQR